MGLKKRDLRLQKVAENKASRPKKPQTVQRTVTVELSDWKDCPACKSKKCKFCGSPK